MKTRNVAILGTLTLALSVAILSGCETLPSINTPQKVANDLMQKGSLKIFLKGEFSRSTQATAADIDYVTFGVEVAGSETQYQTLTKSQLSNNGNSGSVNFDALPTGEATVSASAYNATNSSIGSTTATTSIEAGHLATVELTLQLVPTYIFPSPTPTPSNLAANLTIIDGPTIEVWPTISLSQTSSGISPSTPIYVRSDGTISITNTDSVRRKFTIQNDNIETNRRIVDQAAGLTYTINLADQSDIATNFPNMVFQAGSYHVIGDRGENIPLTIVQAP